MSFAKDMLEMLTSAYDRSDVYVLRDEKQPSTNIGKLFSLLGYGFDIIREHTEKVRLWDDIDQAQGKSLDRYGGNYGVHRGEAPDELYRIMIKVKILAMLSAGQLDTIINAAAILFGVDAEDIKAKEMFPAKIWLYIDMDRLNEERLRLAETIAELMKRIKAAGIGMRIFLVTYFSGEEILYTGMAAAIMPRIQMPAKYGGVNYEKQERLFTGVPTTVYVNVKFGARRGDECRKLTQMK